ncbi:hypothetical protein C0J52_23421 [Blattella germanica]|nr:hypothetical protein C0J52_23421 [Blattella germanica]
MASTEMKSVSNWCNKMFLENALQRGLSKPNIHVVNFEIEKATASGDNYLSDMFRVSLKTKENGRDNNISLIIKCSPQEENTQKFVSELNMFWREYQALKMVVPKFHNQLETVAPGKYQPFASSCLIHQNIDKISVIVLDDLKTQGFKMANRLLGFDLQHCILVLKILARLHAASASLYEKDPSFTDVFNKKPTVDNKRTRDFFSDLLISLADEIDTWKEDKEYKQYSQRLRNCVPTCGEKMKEALQFSDQGINVFSHGDVWVNNIMFRYNDRDQPKDARFVDFQLSHWCSPAADLLYFLFTSPHPDLWDKHDLLLEEYHNELGKILQMLGLSHLHPSFQELKDEIEKRYFYDLGLFGREFQALKVVLPELHGLLEEVAPGEYQPFAATCLILQEVENRTVIVLDDLKAQGFKMAQRRLGLDLDHCILVIKTLARLHGTSATLYRRNPAFLDRFLVKPGLDSNNERTDKVFAESINSLADEIDTWVDSEEMSQYSERLRKFASCSQNKVKEAIFRKEEEFNVLMHVNMAEMKLDSKIPVPYWLNKDFLEKALRRGEKDEKLIVVACDVKPAVASGDNYMSFLFRVTLKVKDGMESMTRDMSLIVKSSPTMPSLRKMYEVVLPEVHRLLKVLDDKEDHTLAPKCIFSDAEDQSCVLVLEDLKEKQFSMAERRQRLDLNHCIAVLRTLAKFHAATIAVFQNNPSYMKVFRNRVGSDSEELRRLWLDKYFSGALRSLAEEVGSWQDINQTYAGRLRKLADNVAGKLYELTMRDESEFNVLNHGDMFIDFQLSHWTSPALDIIYFLHTSPMEELLNQHDVLLKAYHSALVETMECLGLAEKRPSLEDLKQQMKKRAFYAVFASVGVLPLVLSTNRIVDMNDVFKGDVEEAVVNSKMHANESYRKTMSKFLTIFDEKGFF